MLNISSVYCYLQYFDDIPGVAEEDLPFYGGSVEIADFCPFSQEFSWHLSGEYQRSSFCRIQENQPGETPALSILCLPSLSCAQGIMGTISFFAMFRLSSYFPSYVILKSLGFLEHSILHVSQLQVKIVAF